MKFINSIRNEFLTLIFLFENEGSYKLKLIFIYSLQSVVLCHTWLACLKESNFEKATEFIPERWLDDANHKFSCLVIPFGYGRRMCPGKRFVELELQVVLAQVPDDKLSRI